MSSLKLKTPSGGSVSFNAEDTGSDYTLTVPAGNANVLTNATPGTILQVKQTVYNSTFSTASTTLVDVTGFSVDITPSSTSSKILVHVDTMISANYFVGHLQLVRNSTLIYQGTAAGNRPLHTIIFSQNPSNDGIHQRSSAMYLDSPNTTSSVTYKIQGLGRVDGASSGTLYINRTPQDRDTVGYDARGTSSITVMEVAG